MKLKCEKLMLKLDASRCEWQSRLPHCVAEGRSNFSPDGESTT